MYAPSVLLLFSLSDVYDEFLSIIVSRRFSPKGIHPQFRYDRVTPYNC